MLSALAVSIYVVTSLLILGVELLRRKQHVVDLLSLINLLYFLMYCFVPLNINFLGDDTFRQTNAYLTFGPGDEFHAAVILVSYPLIVLGYFLVPGTRRRIDLSFEPGSLVTVSAVLLALGVTALVIRATEVGGLLNALIYSAIIRTGAIQIESSFAFTWMFLNFPLAGLMLLWATYLQRRESSGRLASRIARSRGVLLIYASVSVLCYIAATGRREFVIVPLLMLLAYANARKHFPGLQLAIIAVFGLLFLSYAPPIMFGLAYGDFDSAVGGSWLNPLASAYQVAVQILGDAYIHWVGMSNVSVGEMGLFADLVNLPAKLLPSRLFGFERSRDILGDASSLFNGYDLRATAAPGEDEPPGFFGYWYANLGLIGVLLGSVLFGVIAGFINRLLSPGHDRKMVAWVMYWWIGFAWCTFLKDGYVEFLLKERLAWWFALFLLLAHRRLARLSHSTYVETTSGDPIKGA